MGSLAQSQAFKDFVFVFAFLAILLAWRSIVED